MAGCPHLSRCPRFRWILCAARYPCPSLHPQENASRWRIHNSEIDKMEVSTPSDFLKPAYFSNRTEFSAADLRFLQKCRSKTEKYLRFPSHSAAVKALAAKTALHNPSTTLHNPSTTLHNPSTSQPNSPTNRVVELRVQCDEACPCCMAPPRQKLAAAAELPACSQSSSRSF
jgi:hypothetical protein